jgi:AraC family transcriptional regulator
MKSRPCDARNELSYPGRVAVMGSLSASIAHEVEQPPAVGGTAAGSAGPVAAAARRHGELDESPETKGGQQLRRHELIVDTTSRLHEVADTVGRLLSDAGKALSADHLDAAESFLAQASVLLQAERGRQRRQTASHVGVFVARGGLAPWQIRRIIAHIDSHLAERIKVSDFLELTGLSRSHFSRACRTSLGDSAHHFVTRRRIETAKKLMLETSEPLCEIALQCGLSDQAHLSRLFRRAVGMSPSAWRRHQQVEGQSDTAREPEAAEFSDRLFGVRRREVSHQGRETPAQPQTQRRQGGGTCRGSA